MFRGGTVSGGTEAVGESESYADSDTAVCWGDPGDIETSYRRLRFEKELEFFLFLFHRPPTFLPLKTAYAIFQVRLVVDRLSLCRVLESCIVLFIYRHVTSLSHIHLFAFHVLTSFYLLSIDKLLLQL